MSTVADVEALQAAYWDDVSLPVAFDEEPIDRMWGDVTYTLRDGWRMVVFIDCGEWDYVDHIVAPDGTTFDPGSPICQKPSEDDIWHPIFNWSPRAGDARWGRFR